MSTKIIKSNIKIKNNIKKRKKFNRRRFKWFDRDKHFKQFLRRNKPSQTLPEPVFDVNEDFTIWPFHYYGVKVKFIGAFIKKGKKAKVEKAVKLLVIYLHDKFPFILSKWFMFDILLALIIREASSYYDIKRKKKGKSGIIYIPKFLKLHEYRRTGYRRLVRFFNDPYYKILPFNQRLQEIMVKLISSKASFLKNEKRQWDLLAYNNRSFSHFRWW